MSGQASRAQQIYEQMILLYGPSFDGTVGTHHEAKVYATARLLATALSDVERAGNQVYPLRASDLLPLLELDFMLTPGAKDDVTTRRRALAAAELLCFGASYSNVVAGLRAILGTDFYAYVLADPSGAHGWVPQNFPGIVGSGAQFKDARVPARLYQIIDPVVQTGSASWCAYTMLDPTLATTPLAVGDTLLVQGETGALTETVTVTAVAHSPPAGSNASTQSPPSGTLTWSATTAYAVGQIVQPTSAAATGLWYRCSLAGTSGTSEPAWGTVLGRATSDGTCAWLALSGSTCFQATFAYAHDLGATLTTGNFPNLISTQRLAIIAVSAAAAADREKRRKVDELMRKVARGVTRWQICQGTPSGGGGTMGPLTVGAGAGTLTLGSVNYANST
jgi:hypothetical protein